MLSTPNGCIRVKVSSDEGLALQRTGDGGFILAGIKDGVYGCCDDAGFSFLISANMFLVKTDADGNETWTRSFGGSGVNVGHAVVQTSDGGYAIAGETDNMGAGDFSQTRKLVLMR